MTSEFYNIIIDAFGDLPEASSELLEWGGEDTMVFKVTFPGFIEAKVRMPTLPVLIHMDQREAGYYPTAPYEVAEFYADRYQVRAIDALAYLLWTEGCGCAQCNKANRLVAEKFGKEYPKARKLGIAWWKTIQRAARTA